MRKPAQQQMETSQSAGNRLPPCCWFAAGSPPYQSESAPRQEALWRKWPDLHSKWPDFYYSKWPNLHSKQPDFYYSKWPDLHSKQPDFYYSKPPDLHSKQPDFYHSKWPKCAIIDQINQLPIFLCTYSASDQPVKMEFDPSNQVTKGTIDQKLPELTGHL